MALAAIALFIPVSVAPGSKFEPKAKITGLDPVDLHQILERLIIQENRKGVRWLNKVAKRPVREITPERAYDLAVELAELEARNSQFFWECYFPMVWVESIFSNLINDKKLGAKRRSVGYCGLRVDTARRYAKKLGYKMPKGRAAAELWLVNHWKATLKIGYAYLYDLYETIGQDGLMAMSAYRTGLAGWKSGRVAITEWMQQTRRKSQNMLTSKEL